MRSETRPVWTTTRQLAGNLVPLLTSVPVLVAGIKAYTSAGMTGPSLWILAAFPPVAWLATNFLGPCGSWGLKREMQKRLHHERPFDKTERHFVGSARPKYRGLLDPHEDVGFLLVHEDRLEFVGSKLRIELPKPDVKTVRFRPNPHSWVGLGRWVSVEGQAAGQPVRLLVEPRERGTLIGNLGYGSRLKKRLEAWLAVCAEKARSESAVRDTSAETAV